MSQPGRVRHLCVILSLRVHHHREDPRLCLRASEDPPTWLSRCARDCAHAELTPLFSLQENTRSSYFLAEKIDLRIPQDCGTVDLLTPAEGWASARARAQQMLTPSDQRWEKIEELSPGGFLS